MTSFDELGLSRDALDAISLLDYETPTPVQERAIPAVLAGHDVIAGAKTGTGKTAAFALPCMDKLRRGGKGAAPRMLVVTPTRELAEQIGAVCSTISAITKHRILVLTGGVSYNPQIDKLNRGVDLLISTPGRLIDLMGQNAVELGHVRFFVLDEADRMLDMGFAPDIKRIVAQLPAERQTMLFTATVDDAVERSIGKLTHDPVVIEIDKRGEAADTVSQSIVRVPHTLKASLLIALLREQGSQRVIVFARTRGRADTTARRLNRAGISAAAIHSDRSQNQRRRALHDFDSGTVDVIVATDVLARGIDVEHVSYVVNYDIPVTPEDYVHRIGRTGRAGEAGRAITFVSPENEKMLKDIQKLTHQTIPEITVSSFDRRNAEEEAAQKAISAACKRDPEIALAVKEQKAKEKRKAKAKARARDERTSNAAQAAGSGKPSHAAHTRTCTANGKPKAHASQKKNAGQRPHTSSTRRNSK